ncbi:hypothetical protein AVEN_36791-1 [Araneus ventricosus]|uniref:CCHC-type domain-containing protein n=1 Tax=Araneus ventricosus TaxID=182803 RepID=A0A4Y2KNL6_ARAVE|nr:hypothetical protein AVEN_36791-1 [Araneus ventricosus]
MKGIAEDLYQTLLVQDFRTADEFLKRCREIESLRRRRITRTRFQRLPDVSAVSAETDVGDIRSLMREIVREELAKVLPEMQYYTNDEPESPPDIVSMVREEVLAPITAPRRRNTIPRRNTTSRRSVPVRSPPKREAINSTVPMRKTDLWRTDINAPLCYHCGRPGHVLRYCRERRQTTFNVFFKFNTTNTVVVELHFNNFLLNIFICYFPPNDDIEDLLNEWGGFNFLNCFNLLIGDFNCKSSSWGYDSDNYRGRKFMEFIASSNLHVCNIFVYGPTFQSTINVGFPDLTLISPSIANYVKNWGVLDTETHSDHKYIYFSIEIDNIPETDFYFKSTYDQNKFMKYIKSHLDPLREKLKLANNTVYLNDLFNELTSMVQKGAFKTLKKKPKKLEKKFSFWNEDLRLTRNKVNKLFKIYRKHKAENSNVDLIQSSGNAYRRERAVF